MCGDGSRSLDDSGRERRACTHLLRYLPTALSVFPFGEGLLLSSRSAHARGTGASVHRKKRHRPCRKQPSLGLPGDGRSRKGSILGLSEPALGLVQRPVGVCKARHGLPRHHLQPFDSQHLRIVRCLSQHASLTDVRPEGGKRSRHGASNLGNATSRLAASKARVGSRRPASASGVGGHVKSSSLRLGPWIGVS